MRDIVDLIGIVISLYVAVRCVEICSRADDKPLWTRYLCLPAIALIVFSLGAAVMLGLDMAAQRGIAVPLP